MDFLSRPLVHRSHQVRIRLLDDGVDLGRHLGCGFHPANLGVSSKPRMIGPFACHQPISFVTSC